MRGTQVIAEIVPSSRMHEINILIKTSDASPLDPQMIVDAVSDLLLLEYGAYLEGRDDNEFDA